MIRELVELGKRLKKEGGDKSHDALKNEDVSILIYIDKNGKYKGIQELEEKIQVLCESLPAKKGKARLIIDKPEEVLGYTENEIELALKKKKPNETNEDAKNRGIEESRKKHKRYLDKIKTYDNIPAIAPLNRFYENKTQLNEVRKDFKAKIKKAIHGQIAFILNTTERLNENHEILEAIKKKYESENIGGSSCCSVCGSNGAPVKDKPHGVISNVPGGDKGKGILVSFNWNASESYGLSGNLNSQICTSCARAYTDALNYLLKPTGWVPTKSGKKKPIFNNRRDFIKGKGNDTAVVFWTKGDFGFTSVIFDNPDEDSIKKLFDSLNTGRKSSLKTDMFYSITLSGSKGRIIIRDFIQISLSDMKNHIQEWFEDIDIGKADGTGRPIFAPLWQMGEHLRRANDDKKKDEIPSRAQVYLWKAAIQGRQYQLPLWIMSRAIIRIRMDSYKLSDEDKKALKVIVGAKVSKINKVSSEKDKGETSLSFGRVFTAPRMALVKLVLSRKGKGEAIMKELNGKSQDTAYTSGRILALMAKIQYHAARREPNTSVVSRHYSAVSLTPSSAFGRLFKNTRHHLDKIGQDNPGLKVNLEKALAGLCNKVDDDGGFPSVFNLEEQGRFALGFYHQRFKPVKGDEDEREAHTDDITSDDDNGESD